MNLKRIVSILFILLAYIALAGAMQNIISRFIPAKPELPYAEVRMDADQHIQVLICKDWVSKPGDAEDAGSSGSAEVLQDVYYWIDLKGASKSEYFTAAAVHANGPVPQRAYAGVIRWDQDQKRISINLHRTASTSKPFGANGTYVIRKITPGPFMTESSDTDLRQSPLPLMAAR